MPKHKKQKLNSTHPHPKHHDRRKPNATSNAPLSSQTSITKQAPKQASQSHIVPFDVFDNVLLVGEGDLSFTLSLLLDHGCASLTATTFDSHDALLDKYPHAQEHMQQIQDEEQTILHGVDAAKLYSHKQVKRRAPYDRIFFNFPHTGGVSTDVNRQVRANQALLSAFFQAAISLLSPSGTVLVTLFEAEPYTLWNVRDLGRHAGLMVRRSWRFEKDVYPLYRHARTIGVVKSKSGEVSETAWKGEERPARTYEFGLKDGEEMTASSRKRTHDNSDHSDGND